MADVGLCCKVCYTIKVSVILKKFHTVKCNIKKHGQTTSYDTKTK